MGQGPVKMPTPGKQPITRGPVNPGQRKVSGKPTMAKGPAVYKSLNNNAQKLSVGNINKGTRSGDLIRNTKSRGNDVGRTARPISIPKTKPVQPKRMGY